MHIDFWSSHAAAHGLHIQRCRLGALRAVRRRSRLAALLIPAAVLRQLPSRVVDFAAGREQTLGLAEAKPLDVVA